MDANFPVVQADATWTLATAAVGGGQAGLCSSRYCSDSTRGETTPGRGEKGIKLFTVYRICFVTG
jgi:hypothetical protein